MTLEARIEEVAKRTPSERAELVEAQLSLDAADVPLTPAQEANLTCRVEEYRNGEARMIPGDVAIARLRSMRRND